MLINLLVLFTAGLLIPARPVSAQVSDNPSASAAWSIVASYSIPGKASGLAYDGTYIYFGIYGTNGEQIFKFNPTNGTNSLLCSGPFGDAYGLTYKSPNLVTINQPSSSAQPATALEFNMSGTQISTITLPNHYMSGIAWDNGSYWVCTYYPDPGTVYHINSSGAVLSQFTPPANQPWDICMQGSNLWIADYNANMLYKVSTAGTLLESHASQGTKPSGIVYDGTYLWYCDGQLGAPSTLYKVDLMGSGTPVITVPVTSHNYGTVPVGGSASWNCQVQNTGTANLVINSIGIPVGQPITTTYTTPGTIPPGGSASIPLIYQPVAAGPLYAEVYINSNDPIHPSVTVTLTGNGVVTGPHIKITGTGHDWGDRRKGAYSRWYLPVTNDGSQDLLITGLDFSDPHFILDESVILPLTLSPLQTANVGIWFHPEAGVPYTGILSIVSNDPTQNPYNFDLEGTGIDTDYPTGTVLWTYMITTGFDNSPKAIHPIGDITGDGIDDVIVCSEDNYVRCLNGNSSVNADLMWATEIYSGNVYQQNALTVIEDIDNDGYEDVIVGTTGGDRSVRALSGKTGLMLWRYDTHAFGDGGWVYQIHAKYDYNGDGIADVLACAGDDGNLTGPRRVFCLNSLTGQPIWICPTEGAVFSVIGVDDFNGDNQPDVVAGATNAGQTSSRVYGINGANGAILWTNNPFGSSTWALIQIDDFNGDGIRDVASGDYSGNVYFHNVVTGNREKTTLIQSYALVLRFEEVGDVNKDGHPDFTVGHSGTRAVIINGHDASIIWQRQLADKSWNVTAMGDINFDGTGDMAVGTLYQDNRTYFLDGINGDVLAMISGTTPVDALDAIPDIVGDSTMEAVAGGRNGGVVCLSGGYDTTTTAVISGGPGPDRPVRVFPNPADGIVHLEFTSDDHSDAWVQVTDMTGRIIRTINIGANGTSRIQRSFTREMLGIEEEKGGLYFLTVNNGEQTRRVKVIFR